MFRVEPEYTMMDNLESYLAKWTGRDSWPSTAATLESRLRIPDGDTTTHHNFATTYEILTYEVEQTVYTAAIRETAGYQERAAEVGERVMIQYNPFNPAKSYYAPACRLANRLIVSAVVLAGLSAVVLAVYVFQRSS